MRLLRDPPAVPPPLTLNAEEDEMDADSVVSADGLLGRPFSTQGARLPPLVAVLAGLAVAGAAAVLLAPASGGQLRQASPGALTQGYAAVATAAAWTVCASPGSCANPPMQAWATAPATLAGSVDAALGSLPGVNQKAFGAVAGRWRAAPPTFKGASVTLEQIAAFVKEVLASDPFGTGGSVPYVDFHVGGAKVVAITQRQVAFLAANALMGNHLLSGDGLSEALHRCSARGRGDSAYSLLSMLAILSRELAGGTQGSMVIAATPGASDNKWAERLQTTTLSAPTVCQEIGAGSAPSCGKPDFMSGGATGQAMVDIAGTVVGGGSQLCGLANSQDESLVQFYGEVLTFAFFVGSGGPKMLPVPMVLLGTRVYLSAISGESTSTGGPTCGKIPAANWLNNNILEATMQVPLNGGSVTVAASAFVAVASKSTAAYNQCGLAQLMNNNCDVQRRHTMNDVSLWYRAFEPNGYAPAVREAVAGVVQSVGTGPWGAGVWYGDSQQYFLATWLATSLLSNRPGLDYYVYDHFCENPGNQCFVLGAEGCAACVAKAGVGQINAGRCGAAGIQDMIQTFTGRPALVLFNALKSVGGPPSQVFDLMKGMEPQLDGMLAPPPVISPPAPKEPAGSAGGGEAGIVASAGQQPGFQGSVDGGGMLSSGASAAAAPDRRSYAVKVIAMMIIIGGTVFLAVAVWQMFANANRGIMVQQPRSPLSPLSPQTPPRVNSGGFTHLQSR